MSKVSRLRIRSSPDLPPLAWLASLTHGFSNLLIGSQVEAFDGGIVEGAWDGRFGPGPSATSTLCGSAALSDENGLVLLPGFSPLARLFVYSGASLIRASNSLPLLLSSIGKRLEVRNTKVRSRTLATKYGFDFSPTKLMLEGGDQLQLVGGAPATLARDGQLVRWDRQPRRAFSCFTDYEDELKRLVYEICENAADLHRHHQYRPTVPMSAGYDSTATAAVAAKIAGTTALTMVRRSPDTPDTRVDDPRAGAAALGLPLTEVERGDWMRRTDPLVDAAICATGSSMIDNPTTDMLDLMAGKIVLHGAGGDSVWSVHNFRAYDDIVRGDVGGQGLGELRLWFGFLLLPVPFLAADAHPSILRISRSAEMEQWRIPGPYDRPIPRRLAEEAGVPREAFGQKKFGGGAMVGAGNRRLAPAIRLEAIRDEVASQMSVAGAESFAQYVLTHWALAELDGPLSKHATPAFEKIEALNHRVGQRFSRYGVRAALPRLVMARLAAQASAHSDVTALWPHWGSEYLQQLLLPALREAGVTPDGESWLSSET